MRAAAQGTTSRLRNTASNTIFCPFLDCVEGGESCGEKDEACVREPARHTCRDDRHHTFQRSNCLQLRWACGVKTLRKGVRLNSQMLN